MIGAIGARMIVQTAPGLIIDGKMNWIADGKAKYIDGKIERIYVHMPG